MSCLQRRQMAQCPPSCLPRKGWFVALVVVSIIVTMGLVFFDHTFARKLRSQEMEETVAVMRTRLKFLESQYRGRQQEVADEQARLVNGCNPDVGTGSDVPNVTYHPALTAFLKDISGSKASDGLLSSARPDPIKVPFSLRIMPHLMDDTDSLRPAYQMRTGKPFADYIIGVPHVRRDKEIYLFDTIRGLLDNMDTVDRNLTMIVIMIGETNLTYVVETAHRIEKTFPKAVAEGMIEVISPNANYYPDLDDLPLTLGDSKKRVKWRSKQNLDAIFLMAFSHSKCLYYLMIEDDVLASFEYMKQIRIFTAESTVTNPGWFFIQYSTTGGIGKLFRSTDLIHFMTYVQLFYVNMPIDWLTESYLADRSCGINKGAKECAEAKSRIRPTYKSNLFKHIGLYSSLKGKIQKVKNAKVQKGPEYFPHENPPVSKIECGLIQHLNYSMLSAYTGLNFFWGHSPQKDTTIEFWFETPGMFDRYIIRSGNMKHVNDRIYKAVFEVLPVSNIGNGTFEIIDEFDEFGIVEGKIDVKYGDIQAMRIRFTEASKYWVTISEIEFVYMNERVAARYRKP